jgi:Acetyltransferases
MIVVRAYSVDDLDAVAELMTELGYPVTRAQMRSRMEAIGSHPDYATLVAELDGEAAGLVGLRLLYGYEYDQPIAQISTLVTKAAYRGRGIGKALIRHAEKWAAERGAAAIVVTSGNRPDREAAHRFYHHMGFAVTGLRFAKKL